MLREIWLQLVPPILLILDDYMVVYKRRGVFLIHSLVSRVDADAITNTGLEKVFFEVSYQ